MLAPGGASGRKALEVDAVHLLSLGARALVTDNGSVAGVPRRRLPDRQWAGGGWRQTGHMPTLEAGGTVWGRGAGEWGGGAWARGSGLPRGRWTAEPGAAGFVPGAGGRFPPRLERGKAGVYMRLGSGPPLRAIRTIPGMGRAALADYGLDAWESCLARGPALCRR